MRILKSAIAAAIGLALAVGTAAAAPLSSHPRDDGILLVSGGCGPGGFRAANGACYPRRPPPPRFRRPCPPGMHPTPYGCRRNY